MTEILFHPDVELEIRTAYDWYQDKAHGLGDDFISELESSFQAISELPTTWPKFKKGFRRYLLSRFPFAVIYKQSKSSLYVVAIMHQSQRPAYWVKRV
ncbi:MAG TPA: type II toxin-antitoxin system RelE/ParE family toxin [Pseudomonadales bacterium]|nr:type II toxin-antitoxin system RelE/ParE family toxin [Pseudomonadales bacterium]